MAIIAVQTFFIRCIFLTIQFPTFYFLNQTKDKAIFCKSHKRVDQNRHCQRTRKKLQIMDFRPMCYGTVLLYILIRRFIMYPVSRIAEHFGEVMSKCQFPFYRRYIHTDKMLTCILVYIYSINLYTV